MIFDYLIPGNSLHAGAQFAHITVLVFFFSVPQELMEFSGTSVPQDLSSI